jgi:hypothetical protein
MTGQPNLILHKSRTLIPHSLLAFASACRVRVSTEMVRLGRTVEHYPGLRMPFSGEPAAQPEVSPEAPERDARIVPSGIIILGLAEVIFAGYLVGCYSGGIHPVWKVIMAASGIGIAVFSARLLHLLLRARRA